MNNTRKDDAALTNAGVPPEEETLAQHRMRMIGEHVEGAEIRLEKQVAALEKQVVTLRSRIKEVEAERDELRLNQQIPPCPAKEQLEEAIARIRAVSVRLSIAELSTAQHITNVSHYKCATL